MFNRLTIAKRLALCFGSMVLIVVINRGYVTYSGKKAAADMAAVAEYRANELALQQALTEINIARYNFWMYMTSGDISKFQKNQDLFRDASLRLDTLAGQTSDLGRRAQATGLSRMVVDFAGKVATLHTIRERSLAFDSPEAKALTGPTLSIAGRIDADSETLSKSYAAAANDKAGTIKDEMSRSFYVGLILTGLSISLGLALSIAASRTIAKPIKAMTMAMIAMAEGRLDAEIPAAKNEDEIGEMAKAMSTFRNGLLEARQLSSEKDRERIAGAARTERMEGLTRNFDGKVSDILRYLAESVTGLEGTAQALAANSRQTSQQAGSVSAATEEAAASVSVVSAAADQLSASIREITRQAYQASRISSDAADEVDRAGRMVNSLSETAESIGGVVKLINDIAGKTNLLALNATIEAARAGEAGRGFAVVAGEVKDLAQQTARATGQITGQIDAIQQSTRNAVATIGGIVTRIGEMKDIAAAIAAAVEQQSAATSEIASNVQQVAAGTKAVSANIAGVTGAAAETGAAADEMLSSSHRLAEETASLRDTVTGFLSDVTR